MKEQSKIRKFQISVNIEAKLYTNLGFSIEGVCIDHGIYDGVFSNVLRMALFNINYLEGRI